MKQNNDNYNSRRFFSGLSSMRNVYSSWQTCIVYLTLICSMLTVSVTAMAAEKISSEARIKAAYIYNFMRFTRCPSEDSKSNNVCVYGYKDDYDAAFRAMTTLRKAGKAIGIRFVDIDNELPDLNKCQIIFVTSAAISKTSTVLTYIKDSHSLTVGESDQFLEQGGMVNFIRRGNKIRFEINVTAYEMADLKISSKVLRIADRLLKENKI